VLALLIGGSLAEVLYSIWAANDCQFGHTQEQSSLNYTHDIAHILMELLWVGKAVREETIYNQVPIVCIIASFAELPHPYLGSQCL
jgi:hypothetical protein